MWSWYQKEAAKFTAVKNLLSSKSILIQYNDNLPLVLIYDASPFGVEAVLSHHVPNGTEAPIAFYSRTFSAAERNYSQLDKDTLAVVSEVKSFHKYLYGRHFKLITDHNCCGACLLETNANHHVTTNDSLDCVFGSLQL